MADKPRLALDEIERLLNEARSARPHPNLRVDPPGPRPGAPPGVEAPTGGNAAGGPPDADLAQSDVDLLLKEAEQALASIEHPLGDPPPGAVAYQLEDFVGAGGNGERATLDLIRDVQLDLRIEFGRTHMYVEDVLKLRKGSVVPLDKLAVDPVDIFVNGRLVAKGEVLVLNDNFCVRVAQLVAGNTVAP